MADLHKTLSEKLNFPDFYGHNWDAFWDNITGLIEMPKSLVFYQFLEFQSKFPKDSEILTKFRFAFNQLDLKSTIEYDYLNELLTKSEYKVGNLFERRPAQYGLRGDIYLWNELETELKTTTLPDSEFDLEKIILDTIQNLTNYDITERKRYFVEKYNHGGMSGGSLSAQFWLDRGISLIIGRFRQIKNEAGNKTYK
ncbi:barstar family protein [Cellulophaga baltica 4]|nr:barstar family protein [Cellulophaga baltica 4]